MNGYDLSRQWFDFAFENKDCKVHHTALYLWIVELNNRLGWKEEFGLPMSATMEGLSIGNKTTYSNTLKDLVSWGFIVVVQEAKNQFQSCIIKICRYESEPALSPALSTALYRHSDQHCTGIESSTVTIDKPLNNETFKPLNLKTDVDADRVADVEYVLEPEVKEKKTPSPKVAPKGSPSVHSRIKQIVESKNEGYYWQAKDGSATKSIIKKITFRWGEKHGAPPNDDQTVSAFQWLIDNLPEWYQNKWDTCLLESKFEAIVKEINDQPKNGSKKKGNSYGTPGANGISPRLQEAWELLAQSRQSIPT